MEKNEKIREQQHKYQLENEEKIREQKQKYNMENIEKIREQRQKYDTDRRNKVNQCTRLKKFKMAVRNGPIYPCSSSHRLLYLNGVRSVMDDFREKLNLHDNFYDCMVEEILAFDGGIYLCHTCYNSLSKKKCPTMSLKNGLYIDETPSELNLSELECVLIAKNILFFKLFKLPKSRWTGIRDKVVNVPINDNDLISTLSNVTKLPRGPDNAGLLPVKLKRKIEYSNFVLESYIDPTKLVKAVGVLKELGHPCYLNVTINERFSEQVKSVIDNVMAGNKEIGKIAQIQY